MNILKGSSAAELAVDTDTGKVVGYTTALSDGVTTMYVSYLEVLPDYQGQGIGTQLTCRLLEKFRAVYAVNLHCDDDVQPFYERFGMRRAVGMMIRRYEHQAGS